MVEIVAILQSDFRNVGQTSLRTQGRSCRIDASLCTGFGTLWLTGHARRRSIHRLRNFVDLRGHLR
jgi:hypothetical protein